MANKEHVKLIKKGRKAWDTWNIWRQENLEIAPDLSGADLSRAFLTGADLSGADLTRADLSGAYLVRAGFMNADLRWANLGDANLSTTNLIKADLGEANLGQANLIRADLRGASLVGANLREANLTAANLGEADLSEADLTGTSLNGADLSGTDLTGAFIGQTIFADQDLSTVKGLETITHRWPSTIGVDTLFKSEGKIPEAFLRGVGLPESFITYLPSLISRPIEFYSCFISYSHADKSFARRLHDALQGRGIRCWLDDRQLLPGEKIYSEVDRGIRLWDKVLLCCSKDALTSWWVDNEIKIAFDKEQQLWRERKKEVLALIPLNLDEYLFSGKWQSGLATEVKARMAANFGGWEQDNKKFEEQFERLVRALRTDTGGKEPPPAPQL